MVTPILSDDTKPYAGPDAHDARAKPKDADHGHDGPHRDLKPMGTPVVLLFVGGLVVLLAALFVLGWWPRHQRRVLAAKEIEELGNARPVVGIATPKTPTAFPKLEVPGDAQAFQSTAVYPRANGYLKRRLVDIGDKVTEGQLLAEIEAPEVDAQLAAADANLQQAEASATKAKDDYDLAEATYQRYESFSKTGGVTQQQLDEKRSAFTSAKSTLAGANATVRADEAEVQRLTALQGFQKIYAPFAGTITTRGYDVGALLSATGGGGGRELFQIQQVDTLRVFVNIPQSYATFVKAGQPVKFAVRNYPGRTFDGQIARTSAAIDQSSRTLRVEADFPNKSGELFPGMYGTLQYQVQQNTHQLIIPSSALVFGPEGMQVAVVDEQNKVRFHKVTLGNDLGVDVEIVEGLKGDEKVVTNPGERLIDGLEVQAMAPKTEQANAASPGNAQNDPQAGKGATR